MASINTTIRLEKAQKRLNKRIYPTDIISRSIAKLIERENQLSKDIDKTFGIMYQNGFRPNIDNKNPVFFNDFDFVLRCQKEIERINNKIYKLCIKINKTEKDIIGEMYALNAGRGSVS